MKIYMIRHGKTKGNQEHRYVGSTDEPLLLETVCLLKERKMPNVDVLYTSPLKRCMETASLLFPKMKQRVIEDFRECEFGEFEYKNYQELNGNPDYQRFIDTMGECGFPGGEDRKIFQERCVHAFEQILFEKEKSDLAIAMIVHGGTIMAIMDAFSKPHADYYDWQVGNGEGFFAETLWSEQEQRFYLTNIQKLETGGKNA